MTTPTATTPQTLDRIHRELPGYQAAISGPLDEDRFEVHGIPGHDLAPLAPTLRALALQWSVLYDGLGGAYDFGSNDEVLISASRGFVLLRVDHPRRRYLAVQISSSGNVGYLRFRMRQWLKELAR
ncbi:MAG: hypothetical protein ABMB14_28680 [Myxococcota bacterium]